MYPKIYLVLVLVLLCETVVSISHPNHAQVARPSNVHGSFLRHNPTFNQTGELTLAKHATAFEQLPHAAPGDKKRGLDDEGYDAINLLFWMQENGIILEVGALDGTAFSVSRDFLAFKWHRILVEATPKWHHLAAKRSFDATYVAAAVCNATEDVHYLVRPKTDNAINGIAEYMSPNFMEQMHPHIYQEAMKTSKFNLQLVDWSRFHDHAYHGQGTEYDQSKHDTSDHAATFVHKLPCIRLSRIIAELAVKHINLLIVDTVGSELSALNSIDFKHIIIDVICVDVTPLFSRPGFAKAISQLLTSKGFVFLFNKGRNAWYRHNSFHPHRRKVSMIPYAENKVSQSDIKSVDLLPTKGLQVGHYSNHLGSLKDQDYTFHELGMKVSNFFLLIYDITEAFAASYFEEHKETINSFDIIVTSDTTPLSRIFLQNLKNLKGRLVVWICNRLDYDVYDDKKYFALIRDNIARKDSKVMYVPYTEYEKQDAYARLGFNIADSPTITPHGLQLNESWSKESLVHYSKHKIQNSHEITKTANVSHSNEGIFVTRYQNDQLHINVPKIYSQNDVAFKSSQYGHPSELRKYSALVTFPDAMSKFLVFETIQYGIPVILPSLQWLERLNKGTYFFNADNQGHKPDIKYWYENEWYRYPDCRIYVENEMELVRVSKQLNEGTYPDLEFITTNMKERAKIISDMSIKKWAIIYAAAASSSKAAVYDRVFSVDKPAMETCLDKYKAFLRVGTLAGLYEAGPHIKPWSVSFSKKYPNEPKPGDRYESFIKAFQLMIDSKAQPKVIVEMGVTRSFRDWQLAQQLSEWLPRDPKTWDWGEGGFTRMASECNQHIDGLRILAVDASKDSCFVARTVTQNYSFVSVHHTTSAEFLRNYDGAPMTIFYADLGDPVGFFHLHLEEAQILTERRNEILARDAYVLIDDVRNMGLFQRDAVKEYGEPTHAYGKSRDSIPYMLAHGWEVVFSGYQWIMKAPPMSES